MEIFSYLSNLLKRAHEVPETAANPAIVNQRNTADQDEAHRAVRLGKSYALGVGVEQNVPEAIRLFKLAAGLGNPYALCELGKLYALDYGSAQDYGGKKYYAAAIDCFQQPSIKKVNRKK